MSGFALLQLDVEDASDLAPAQPMVAEPEPAAAAPAPPAPEPRNVSFGERGHRGWRDSGAEFGGRGRRGMRGGRGRGRGRGMRGRGGRGAFGAGSWDVRNSSGSDNPHRGFQHSEESAPHADTPPADRRNEDETREEGAADGDREEGKTAPPQKEEKEREMTLDEYMAKKAAMQLGMRSLSTKAARKANDGQVGYGGKMAVLKKKVDAAQDADETSIVSAVQMKQVVESRSTKDSTHAAVADNAKNQEFFKTPARPFGQRSYQGRDMRNGNGDFRRGGDRHNGGFRGGYRGGRYEGGDNRYRGSGYNNNNNNSHNSNNNSGRDNDDYRGNRESYNRQRPGAPNVDDQAAFPSLSA